MLTSYSSTSYRNPESSFFRTFSHFFALFAKNRDLSFQPEKHERNYHGNRSNAFIPPFGEVHQRTDRIHPQENRLIPPAQGGDGKIQGRVPQIRPHSPAAIRQNPLYRQRQEGSQVAKEDREIPRRAPAPAAQRFRHCELFRSHTHSSEADRYCQGAQSPPHSLVSREEGP